jgi:5-methylcytosine-specific restriction endonuclease McrA
MRRRFSKLEKAALAFVSHGECSQCKKPLPADWHADHVYPWSRGGETAATNGQALCPRCNRKKGAKV